MLQDNSRTDRFGLLLVIGAIAAVAVLGGLVFAFVATADGINQSPEELARARGGGSAHSEAAPPAAAVQADHGNASARLVENGGAIELDFSSCTPGEHRFDLAGGVATFQFVGRDGDDCILDYGADPGRPGVTTFACRVPMVRGSVQFTIQDGKPDMAVIAGRCAEI